MEIEKLFATTLSLDGYFEKGGKKVSFLCFISISV